MIVTRVKLRREPARDDVEQFSRGNTQEDVETAWEYMKQEYEMQKVLVEQAESCPNCSKKVEETLAWWKSHSCTDALPRVLNLAQRSMQRPISQMEEDDQVFFRKVLLCTTCFRAYVDARKIAYDEARNETD